MSFWLPSPIATQNMLSTVGSFIGRKEQLMGMRLLIKQRDWKYIQDTHLHTGEHIHAHAHTYTLQHLKCFCLYYISPIPRNESSLIILKGIFLLWIHTVPVTSNDINWNSDDKPPGNHSIMYLKWKYTFLELSTTKSFMFHEHKLYKILIAKKKGGEG